MKALFSLLLAAAAVAFLVVFPAIARAQDSLPPKPDSRIADYAGIMQADDRDRLSKELQEQFNKNGISVYIATFQSLSVNDASLADNLRQAWVADPKGFVVLYNQQRDKLSVSLTPEISQTFSSSGELQDLFSQIEAVNKAGPAIAVPRTVDTIINELHPVDDGSQRLLAADDRRARTTFVVPGLILLVVAIYGLRLAWFRLKRQKVFEHSRSLPIGSAQPKFGSDLGGTNFASVKFR
ncbi:MAG TPA: hypothetical protein VIT91_20745 [Chthoniobacterales bacterium]